MTKNRRLFLSVFAMLGLALGSWAILSAGDTTTAPSRATEAIAAEAFSSVETADLFTPAAGGSTKCCDPSQEPGVGGNPLCFEGHTCCSDGVWRCNNPDATPSCDPGTVCGGGCALSGAPCTSHTDCCSGKCKGNGTCR